MRSSLESVDKVIADIEQGRDITVGKSKDYTDDVINFMLDGGYERFALNAARALKTVLGTSLSEAELVDHYIASLTLGNSRLALPFLKGVKVELEKGAHSDYLVERIINAVESGENLTRNGGKKLVEEFSAFVMDYGKDYAERVISERGFFRTSQDFIDDLKKGNEGGVLPFLYALRDEVKGVSRLH